MTIERSKGNSYEMLSKLYSNARSDDDINAPKFQAIANFIRESFAGGSVASGKFYKSYYKKLTGVDCKFDNDINDQILSDDEEEVEGGGEEADDQQVGGGAGVSRDSKSSSSSRGRREMKFPHVVYSHFLDRGVYPIQKLLAKMCPDLVLETISGSIPTKDRKSILTRYNRGSIDVLFITDASKEGVDLLGTAYIHLVDPCVNKEMEKQTCGRVIRFNSHKMVPFDTVFIIKYISVFPSISTLNQATLESLNQYWFTRYLNSNKNHRLTTSEFRENLVKKMKEVHGITIDEKIENSNIKKYKRLEPYINILRDIGIHY